MAYDPYRDDPYRNDNFRPGEIPATDTRPGYSSRAIIWIICAVVLILGGAVWIGSRDASTPEASIQSHPQTTGSGAQAE
jgi:hypothetical protein